MQLLAVMVELLITVTPLALTRRRASDVESSYIWGMLGAAGQALFFQGLLNMVCAMPKRKCACVRGGGGRGGEGSIPVWHAAHGFVGCALKMDPFSCASMCACM